MSSESPCPTLSPLAETLRAHVAEYKKTLALFEEEGSKELAEKLARIKNAIETTKKSIDDALEPFGYSLDTFLLTPEDISRLLKEAGSVAELDPNFEGGIIHVDVDPKIIDALKTWGTAQEAFKNADSTRWYIDSDLNDYPWQPLTETTLDVLVIHHGRTTPGERNALVFSMGTLGYRPLTLAELMAVMITKPEYNKRAELLNTYEKHKIDGLPRSPYAHLTGSRRGLRAGSVENEWGKDLRFLFVRKSNEPKT
jgi:hypothetical protein